MTGDNKINSRQIYLSSIVFVLFFISVLSLTYGYMYTDAYTNITFTSDKSSYSCYPGCTAFINITSYNESFNGVYNITFNNTATFNTTDVNFTIYNCSLSDATTCTEATSLENFSITNGTNYPFKVVINMTGPLYGKWNFTVSLFNGTNYANITFDPYIDSINLTSPSNNTYTNNTQPDFNFTYYSEYNTTLNCSLYLNSAVYGNTTATNGTETNITANATLPNAVYSWLVGCDTDGDSTDDIFSASNVVTIDNTSAILTLNSPANLSKVYKKNESNFINFTVNFTYTELYPTLFWVRVYNSTSDLVYNATNSSNISAGTSTALQNISMPLLSDGFYDVEIEMHDRAGNVNSTRENESLVIDNTFPQLSIVSPTSTSPFYARTIGSTINISVNLSYTEINPRNYIVQLLNSSGSVLYNSTNSSAITAGSNYSVHDISLSTIPPEGKYTVRSYFYDLAGNSNTTRENESVYIDNTPPSVILNTSDNFWDADGNNIILEYTITDFSGFTNCSLWITNSSGGNWHADITNTTAQLTNNSINNFTLNGLDSGTNENGTYTWNVQCYDMENNTAFASANRTLMVGDRADLIISDISVSPSSPYSGQNFTANVTVKNIGTANVTNPFNISFSYAGGTANTSTQIPYLAPGAETYVLYYNLTALSGNRSLVAIADYGNNWTTERTESNNTRTEYLSTDLNVTLMNVITHGTLLPGSTITLNISVKFYNGTPITWLNASHLGAFIDGYSSRSDWDRIENTTSRMSGGAGGFYTINYTIPLNNYDYINTAVATRRIAEPGNHTTKIRVNMTYGSGNFSGWANDTNSYSIIAPQLEVSIYGLSTAMTYPTGNTDSFYVRARNTGTEDIRNVTVKVTSNDTNFDMESTNTLNCIVPGNDPLANGSTSWTNLLCNGNTILDAEAEAIGTYKVSVTNAYGIGDTSTLKYNSTALASETITVTNSSSSSTSSTDSTTPTSSSNDECVIDDQCNDNEECVSSVCIPLDCESGYSAVNHKCVLNTYNYALKFMSITESIEVVQGESANITFKLKNVGNITLNVKMKAVSSLTGVDVPVSSGVYHVLQPYMVYDSSLEVKTTPNAEVGKGNLTIIGYDKDRKSVSAEYNISITIKPNEDMKKVINTTYDAYIKMFNDFLSDFGTINPNKVSEENYTKLNRSLTTIDRMLTDVKAKLSEGNYIDAQEVLKDVDTMLSEVEAQFTDIKNEKANISTVATSSMTYWIIGLIIVGIVGGVLVYLLLPPKSGYNIRTGYRTIRRGNGGTDKLSAIKSKLRSMKIKKPIGGITPKYSGQSTLSQFKSSYMPGYERQKNVYSMYKKQNPLSKLKELVKKK